MRTIQFIIFFSIVLTIYGAINYYIFTRGLQALPTQTWFRSAYIILFFVLTISYIAGRFLEKVWLSPVSDVLVWIGSFWLAAMVYLFLAAVLFDLFRIVHHFFPTTADTERIRQIGLIVVSSATMLIVIAGFINAIHPRIRRLDITIQKIVHPAKLNIVLVSDIHLGTIVGRNRFCNMVRTINDLEPDLVLLAGDIVDEDLAPVIKENIGDALTRIRSRFGIFAITGNHEYIGGVDAAVTYLKDHNVVVLRDSTARIDDRLTIVGREDRSSAQFGGKGRKALPELMNGVDMSQPIILMDHQPFGLHEAQENRIDLQVSGHTHHGQLWPFNYVTKAIYELSWGYLKKGNTHYYVSSGAGTWGPPVRTGNRPEIVNIVLKFESP